MKHNNALPNVHLRKHWESRVKTWFDHPAKKAGRRAARVLKAKKLAPRPTSLLRPVVRPPTIRYNMKLRLGKGFTLEELAAAKISRKEARGLGIAVDHRRHNRSQEALDRNVKRLLEYKSKLIVFPRRRSQKKDQPTAEQLAKIAQVTSKGVLPIPEETKPLEFRKITSDEFAADAYGKLRKERVHQKLWGAREKKAKEKEEEKDKPAKDKKKKKKGADDDAE